jgi:hypothetical protein
VRVYRVIEGQINGDTKIYEGSWWINPSKYLTTYKYESILGSHSIIPLAVIEYYIASSLRGRIESMAQRAS